MSFSFGSFGDILALAQLAYSVAKTLSDSRGSSVEYQDLILELHSLSAALEGLHRYLSHRGPVRLEYSAENAIKFVLLRCEVLIADFSKSIEAYQRSLQKGGSGSRMRDSWRKIGWGIFRREEVVDLKKKLAEQKATINMMLALSNCTALEKIKRIADEQRNTIMQLPKMLAPEGQGLEKITAQNAEQRELLNVIQESLRADFAKQQEETLNSVRSTAQEQVPFNIQGYLDEFKGAMVGEMQALFAEMAKSPNGKLAPRLADMNRNQDGASNSGCEPLDTDLQNPYQRITRGDVDIRNLTADSNWKTPQPEPASPTLRAVGARQKKKKGPDLSISTSSWATWQPDPTFLPTPPSAEPTLLTPDTGSPGLFGPRSPSDNQL